MANTVVSFKKKQRFSKFYHIRKYNKTDTMKKTRSHNQSHFQM